MIEIPKFLRKHGITEITDKVPPGHQVHASATRFFTLFGKETMDELQKRHHASMEDDPDMEKDPEFQKLVKEYMRQGLRKNQAKAAAAISSGYSNCDVIDIDEQLPKEPDISSFYGTKEDTEALEKELEQAERPAPTKK